MESKLHLRISQEIFKLFKMHNYDTSAELIKEIADLILQKEESVTIEYFVDFCTRIKMGEYGTLYRMPTCFMAMYHQHLKCVPVSKCNPLYYESVRPDLKEIN